MNKYNFIKLINEKPYTVYNLKKDMYGLIISCEFDNFKVLFFNSYNQDNFIIANIKKQDVIFMQEKIPNDILKELESKLHIIESKADERIEKVNIFNYDQVELIQEKEKYVKCGIHNGDTGIVVDNKIINGCVEVDFSGIDEDGSYYGDCISVKIEDLKVIHNKK